MLHVSLRVLLLGALLDGTYTARANPQESIPPAQDSQKQTSNERDDSTIRYGAAFFADKNPKTALDMVNLLPGLTFSAGDTSLRGYSAAAGNVLVDGERPSDKQFSLSDVLTHIPANEVDYIEVIRGGKPGLDMLGQTVVANVVRRKGAGDSTILTLSDGQFSDGRNTPSVTVETTRHLSGGRSFLGAISVSRYVELAEGDGYQVRRDADGNVLQHLAIDSDAGGLTGYAYGVFNAPLWNGNLALNGSVARTDYNYHEKDSATFPSGSSSQLDQYLGGPLGGQLKGELGAHFNRKFGAKWSSESIMLLDLRGQSFSSQLTGSGVVQVFEEHESSGEALARSDLRYAATRDLTAQFSLEGAFNKLHTTNSFTFDGVPILLPNSRATVSETREQVSAQATWVAARSLQLEIGVSIEHSLIESRADVAQNKALTYPKPVGSKYPDAGEQRLSPEVGISEEAPFRRYSRAKKVHSFVYSTRLRLTLATTCPTCSHKIRGVRLGCGATQKILGPPAHDLHPPPAGPILSECKQRSQGVLFSAEFLGTCPDTDASPRLLLTEGLAGDVRVSG